MTYTAEHQKVGTLNPESQFSKIKKISFAGSMFSYAPDFLLTIGIRGHMHISHLKNGFDVLLRFK